MKGWRIADVLERRVSYLKMLRAQRPHTTVGEHNYVQAEIAALQAAQWLALQRGSDTY